jgi:hypothetical protein
MGEEFELHPFASGIVHPEGNAATDFAKLVEFGKDWLVLS